MKCPFCKSIDSRVVDSRLIDDGGSIRRRRECTACSSRFTTYERCPGISLMVIKSDNRREPFDRAKVRNGIIRACSKRNIRAEVIDRIVDDIEQKITESPNSEVKADFVGAMVLNHLKDLDEVAYLRFASVYKKFDRLEAFIKEAKTLGEPVLSEP